MTHFIKNVIKIVYLTFSVCFAPFLTIVKMGRISKRLIHLRTAKRKSFDKQLGQGISDEIAGKPPKPFFLEKKVGFFLNFRPFS